jgi:hypothetical protein
MSRRNRKNKISGQFAWQLVEMLESPAHRVLSLSARRALDRIQIEFAHHGGRDNGRLPVTFDDFTQFGIDRHAVAPALRELAALGFIQITERGRAGNAEFRAPNKFRLTHRETDSTESTNDWRHIKTIEEATTLAATARKSSGKRPHKNKIPVGENPPSPVGETHTENIESPVGETHTTVQCVNPHYYLYLGAGAGGLSLPKSAAAPPPAPAGPGIGHNSGPPLDDLSIPEFLRRDVVVAGEVSK